jgi:hypothetical protein
MMHLVTLLLPVYDEEVAHELTERFGGVTAYARAPSKGLWKETPKHGTTHDDIVVYEVMVDQLDEKWWSQYRRSLETRFAQKELVVHAQEIRRL